MEIRYPAAPEKRPRVLVVEPNRPTTGQLQEHGRAFPPNYLHESWRDYLYWDVELLP